MKNQTGILYVVLSAVLFGTMPLLAKVAYAHGSNAYTVAFGRFFIGSIILGILIFVLPGCSVKLTKGQILNVFKLSVSYALMPILLYSSYNYIDSGMATALHFTYPITVMLIMAIFFRIRPSAKQIVCALICLVGMALLSLTNGKLSTAGIAFAVGSGIVYAVYIVLLGRSGAKELHPLTLAFWMALFSAIEIGVVALASGEMVFELDAVGWAAEIGMALFTTVFALVLFQRGLFLCGEVKASLLSTFEPITSVLIGMIVFQETLSSNEVLGIGCILAAVILLVMPLERKKQGETKE